MSKLIIKRKYGQIPNELLNDPNISLKAKGLFGYLQSKPNNWEFSVQRIQKQLREGKDGISAAMSELKKFGYLENIPKQGEKGRMIGHDYILNDSPDITENPRDGKTVSRKTRDTENTGLYSKKEFSKKENSKKEEIHTTSHDVVDKGDEVNRIIEVFSRINENIAWGRKSTRDACRRMIKRYQGVENVIRMAEMVVAAQGEPYAPTATTPYEMESKIAAFRIYFQKKQNESNSNNSMMIGVV